MAEAIDVERLGRRLRRVRDERDLTLQDVAKEADVSIATLSRIERGGSKDIDAATLIALTNWLRVKPNEFTEAANPPRLVNKSAATTPEAVELYLRADKNLDKRTAHLLAEMFRAAYAHASKKSVKK